MKNIRDLILDEYKDEKFEVTSKVKKYDDGTKYIPLAEKIRMFRSDYPNAEINCTVLADNNIFATVQCEIKSEGGNVIAVAKWYHNSLNVYGINYLATAQSNAVSTALRLLGYDVASEYPDADVDLNMNISEDHLSPSPKTLSESVQEAKYTSFEQCKNIVINNPPFCGKTVGEIIESNFMINEFIDLMNYFVKNNCVLSDPAKIILKNICK